jgi:hypothetical protein
VKRAIILIIVGIAIGAGGLWMATHPLAGKPDADEAPAQKPAAGEDEDKTTITHDTNGNVVVGMGDEMQGTAGIVVKNPEATELVPELKGFGRVADPVVLTGLITDLSTAEATYAVSSNELARLKTLDAQGNISARALQAAEAAEVKDRMALQSAKDHLTLAWGTRVANRAASSDFVQALTALRIVLVRVDIPAGEAPAAVPTGARIVRLSGDSANAEFLGTASGVDPQVQGHGFIFVVPKNRARFLAGEAVTAYLTIPGEPLKGVVIPRDAVVRTEGKGWVYVLNDNGESFTRTEIPLDHPVDDGWFVANGVAPGQHVVVTGAQVLLSEELKASMSPD